MYTPLPSDEHGPQPAQSSLASAAEESRFWDQPLVQVAVGMWWIALGVFLFITGTSWNRYLDGVVWSGAGLFWWGRAYRQRRRNSREQST